MKLVVLAVSILVASGLSTGQVRAPLATGQAVPPVGNELLQTDNETGEIPTFYSHARQVLVAAEVWKHTAKTPLSTSKEFLRRHPIVKLLALPPPTRGLSASDFRIFDNGAEQKINYLQESDLYLREINHEWFIPDIRGTWGSGDSPPFGLPVAKYMIGYIPPPFQGVGCHTIQVVAGDNDVMLNRTSYCDTDGGGAATAEGRKIAAQMENFAKSSSRGSIKVSSRAFVFWSSGVLSLMRDNPETSIGSASALPAPSFTYRIEVHDSRAPSTVQIATEYELWTKLWDSPCPSDNSALYVLGVVYKANGEVAARFRDTCTCGIDPFIEYRVPSYVTIPNRFYTQVELRPGDYDVHVVVSDGWRFGQTRIPLRVDPIDSHAFTISDIALNGILRDASLLVEEAAFVLPAPALPTPLVSKEVQFIPAADAKLKKKSSSSFYFEIYEPLLADRSVEVYFRLRITDLKTGSLVVNAEPRSAAQYVIPGNVVIPIALKADTDKLRNGSYEIGIQASDSTGRKTGWRTAKFEIK